MSLRGAFQGFPCRWHTAPVAGLERFVSSFQARKHAASLRAAVFCEKSHLGQAPVPQQRSLRPKRALPAAEGTKP